VSEQRPILFGEPWFGREEEELLLATLRSGWIGQGPLVQEFERQLAEYVQADHAVAVGSCTAALHLALLAAGVGPGDEVVTTPFTFVATVNAIEHTGATPVFVDIDRQTLNLEPEAVEAALTQRTRAVMPVHFGGRPLDVEGFRDLADRHGLWIIEDGAHAIGAVGAGRPIGASVSNRTITCFSFYPNKNLASAEGGAVVASDGELADRVRRLRLHGLDVDAWARYRTAGYRPSLARAAGFKYNWTDLQAAIALPQLARLEGFLATREHLAAEYDRLLVDIDGVRTLPRPTSSLRERHALHLYQIEVLAPAPARDELVAAMRARGVGVAVHYHGVNHHPYYRDRIPGQFPVSDWASDHLLTLPLHLHMHGRDVERIVDDLAAVLGSS
jgi:dTDP-4-amino-4,6-dideoxygalactose transaminase